MLRWLPICSLQFYSLTWVSWRVTAPLNKLFFKWALALVAHLANHCAQLILEIPLNLFAQQAYPGLQVMGALPYSYTDNYQVGHTRQMRMTSWSGNHPDRDVPRFGYLIVNWLWRRWCCHSYSTWILNTFYHIMIHQHRHNQRTIKHPNLGTSQSGWLPDQDVIRF